MRQPQKYPTIYDYTITISHDMSVIHDVKHYETPMQKLKEMIHPEWDSKTPKPSTVSGLSFAGIPVAKIGVKPYETARNLQSMSIVHSV